jgi:hypothetical protein
MTKSSLPNTLRDALERKTSYLSCANAEYHPLWSRLRGDAYAWSHPVFASRDEEDDAGPLTMTPVRNWMT